MKLTPHAQQSGFTLAELVAVILILGILSVSATAFFDRAGVDTASYADLAQVQISYAQKVAIAQRRTATVTFGANTIALTICQDAACGTIVPIPSPSGLGNFNRPAGVALATNPITAAFTFDALGRPNGFAGNLTVTISGGGSYSFTVERETGYVHR